MIRKAIFTILVGWAVVMVVVSPLRAHDDIDRHRACNHCGMDRKAYGYSRMLVVYADGSQTGVCSLHCAAIELAAHPDRKSTALQVADRTSHALIDATRAYWVRGGSKRGVMSPTPTWAFATREAAERFIRDHGGTPATWEEVLAIARKEVAQ
jgi:nitrous oxide reductase accessory protein NosL